MKLSGSHPCDAAHRLIQGFKFLAERNRQGDRDKEALKRHGDLAGLYQRALRKHGELCRKREKNRNQMRIFGDANRPHAKAGYQTLQFNGENGK
jgi:hypothetical protein